MAKLDPALAALLATYALTPPLEPFALAEQGANNTTQGLHTGAGDLIWKTYTAQANIDTLLYEHHLLGWLADQSLPFAVPAPLLTCRGTTLVHNAAGWQALFPMLPGAPPDRSDAQQAEAAGVALAQLHQALSRYPTTPRPGMSSYGDLERIHRRIPDPFALRLDQLGMPDTPENAERLDWWRGELAALRSFIAGLYRALPWQVIHSDFALSNTLFHAGRLSAILDFEFATPDARAMDLATGLIYTLRCWEGPPQWQVARALYRGYRQLHPLSAEEIAAIPWLMRLHNAVAVIWWLGRDLDAGAFQNSSVRIDYMRQTVAILRMQPICYDER